MFLDRERELGALKKLWKARGGQLVVVYGRRRVGKTELLRQFAPNKLCVFFVAAQTREPENLQAFTNQVRTAFDEPLLRNGRIPDWESGLRFLAEKSRSRRILVILDEFQYLCQENPALPSILQRFWDGEGKQSRLFLVLCGSHISFMEQKVLSEKAPLFGRRTGQVQLHPFQYLESGLFSPGATPEEKLIIYSVFGGTPAYLARWEKDKTLRQNVLNQILSPAAPLYDEVGFLLRTELGETRTYSSILAAIADGCHRLSEISKRTGIERFSVSKYLKTLQGLRLIRREVPLTVPAFHSSRRGRYIFADNYLRFWYRFVLPNLSLIESGRSRLAFDRLIAPNLESYVGRVFEDVCAQFMSRAPEEEWVPCQRIGRHWGSSPELDLVTENVDGRHYIGECKWLARPVGAKVADRLEEAASQLPAKFRTEALLIIFSRRGFTESLRSRARNKGIRLITVDDLYAI